MTEDSRLCALLVRAAFDSIAQRRHDGGGSGAAAAVADTSCGCCTFQRQCSFSVDRGKQREAPLAVSGGLVQATCGFVRFSQRRRAQEHGVWRAKM